MSKYTHWVCGPCNDTGIFGSEYEDVLTGKTHVEKSYCTCNKGKELEDKYWEGVMSKYEK